MPTLKELKEYATKLWDEPTIHDAGDVINKLLTMIDGLSAEPTPPASVQEMARAYGKKRAVTRWTETNENMLADYARRDFLAGYAAKESDFKDFDNWRMDNYDYNEFEKMWGKFWEDDETGLAAFLPVEYDELYQLYLTDKNKEK